MNLKGNKILVGLLLFVILLFNNLILTFAAEEVNELSNKLMMTTSKVEAKTAPDESSETVVVFDADSSVMVNGEIDNCWYRISYQNKTAFIKSSYLKESDVDFDSLDEEMEQNNKESKTFIENYEYEKSEKKQSMIWKIIIVSLVAGIFIVGIVSSINKKNK